MLYDKNPRTIRMMADEIFCQMTKMETFNDRVQELKDKKRKFKSDLKQYKDVEEIIYENRRRVYAHNDPKYHWFAKEHIEK